MGFDFSMNAAALILVDLLLDQGATVHWGRSR